MITGNRGEWSEIYVLLYLLGTGKLYSADENLNRLENVYFPILKIIRKERELNKYEYMINNNIRKVHIYYNNQLIKDINSTEFITQADFLYHKIIESTNSTFDIIEIETFIKNIGCNKLVASSKDKTDIIMQIHDIDTGYEPICGFSIKSDLGNPPTLLNASNATNFIYEVNGLSENSINEINSINTNFKIKDRIKRIGELGSSLEFYGVNNDTFANNLIYIDTNMSKLLSFAVMYHYKYDNLILCKDIVNKLTSENPLRISAPSFYKYKFKKFLCSAALGMMPSIPWSGIDQASGGYIIVTNSGDVLAYHIYNRDAFEEYLLNKTKFERGSTKRHNYAKLYQKDNKTFINLNLQIRFL